MLYNIKTLKSNSSTCHTCLKKELQTTPGKNLLQITSSAMNQFNTVYLLVIPVINMTVTVPPKKSKKQSLRHDCDLQ